MARLPLLYNDPFHVRRPFSISDQRFGTVLSADNLPLSFALQRAMRPLVFSSDIVRTWPSHTSQQDVGSVVQVYQDQDKFQTNLDVHEFSPTDLQIRILGNNQISVEGKHEERQDQHGFIFRHFKRRYVVPKECDMKNIQTNLSPDGMLSITIPMHQRQTEERRVQISDKSSEDED